MYGKETQCIVILLSSVFIGSTQCFAQPERAQSMPSGLAAVRAPEMVRIPTTTFVMGSPVTDKESFAYRPTEKPLHKVTVEEFLIGRFLVTAEEFCAFLNDVGNHGYIIEDTGWIDWRTIRRVNGYYVPQKAADRCPAYPVTWSGAVAYCEWLSRKLGRKVRLPTEAEWEAAARGSEGRLWPWGDEVPTSAGRHKPKLIVKAWDDHEVTGAFPPYRFPDSDECIPFYESRGYRWSHGRWDGTRPWTKAPVGSFPLNATPEGVYDLLGYHSGQWCADPYDGRAYETAVPANTIDDGDEKALRVMRGMYQVRIDYASRHQPILSFRLLIPGDAKWPSDTPGRVWSRKGSKPRNAAMFRLAESLPTIDQHKRDGADPR